MADSKDKRSDETTSDTPADETGQPTEGLIELGKEEKPAVEKETTEQAATPTPEVTPDDASAEPAAGAAAASPKSSTPVGLLAAVGVLGLLLIGLFVIWNPWFGPFNGSREVADLDADKESAADAGCDIANKLFTYDFNKIDDFFTAVQDSSTGRFGSGFVADKEQLRTLFVQSQVVSRAEETSCSLEMIGDEHARVRMQGTQVVVSSLVANGQEQSEHVDLYIDLEKSDDGWKVYDLSPVDSGALGTGVPGTQTTPGTEPIPGTDPGQGTEPTPGTDGQPVPEETPVPEVPNP